MRQGTGHRLHTTWCTSAPAAPCANTGTPSSTARRCPLTPHCCTRCLRSPSGPHTVPRCHTPQEKEPKEFGYYCSRRNVGSSTGQEPWGHSLTPCRLGQPWTKQSLQSWGRLKSQITIWGFELICNFHWSRFINVFVPYVLGHKRIISKGQKGFGMCFFYLTPIKGYLVCRAWKIQDDYC